MLNHRTQGKHGRGLWRACLAASAMASQMPGGRIRQTLILLALLVLIVHCRPWSYTWFADLTERDADEARFLRRARLPLILEHDPLPRDEEPAAPALALISPPAPAAER
jgi:hypothetical protein